MSNRKNETVSNEMKPNEGDKEFREYWEIMGGKITDIRIKDIKEIFILRYPNSRAVDMGNGGKRTGEMVEVCDLTEYQEKGLINEPDDLWKYTKSGFNCQRATKEEREQFPFIQYVPFVNIPDSYNEEDEGGQMIPLDSKSLFLYDENGNDLGR